MTLVAIQGIRGSYSEEAALNLLPQSTIVECEDFASTFNAIRDGRAEYAVVPVENRIVGEIKGAASVLRSGTFRERDRRTLRIDHVLSGTQDASLDGIEYVTSHMEALKQCGDFLDLRRSWRQVISADTASSVRSVVEKGSPAWAAISSRRAVEMYGAKVLVENIADDEDNWTVFCLVERR